MLVFVRSDRRVTDLQTVKYEEKLCKTIVKRLLQDTRVLYPGRAKYRAALHRFL